MQEYRIIDELPYTFIVEVKKISYKGFWFWKKQIEEWVACNCDGRPYGEIFNYPSYVKGGISYCSPRLDPFKTKTAAQMRIDKFISRTKHFENKYKIHEA